jgi:flagellar basal-body rod protein FlgB
MSVTSSQIDFLSRLLDAASLRHQVIAQNVANVNTPGYHRLDVAFEEMLEYELKSDDATIGDRKQPRVIEVPGGIAREDGNNVDIDVEMGRLSKNTMLFNVYSQILATKIAAMRSAIAGR